jgi:hypothetical protein
MAGCKKTRLVPAASEMMTELARHRRGCDMAPFPSPSEETPLVLPIGNAREPMTRAALHNIVKTVFEKAAQELRMRGRISRDELNSCRASPRTGFGTRPDHIWPMGMSTCATFATTWGMSR